MLTDSVVYPSLSNSTIRLQSEHSDFKVLPLLNLRSIYFVSELECFLVKNFKVPTDFW